MGRAAAVPDGPGKRLIADARLRTELELCDRWGIPHSQFRAWSERDRAKALAFVEYQKTVCHQCGTRYDDWDHGAEGEEDAYVATLQRCVGCQVIADKQAEVQRDMGDEEARGMKVALVPAALHAAMEAERDLTRNRRPHDEDEDD